MANVLIASTGIVYHTTMTCPMAQKISEPHSIPQRDAELYFRRTECMKCRKQTQAQEETTVATDERTVAEFELSDLGVDHAQYFQGAGVAFTSWDEVFVGVGDTAHEAANDAVNQFAESDNGCLGWPQALDDERESFGRDNERSAHAECECDCPLRPDRSSDCECHDLCELQHYAALYVRYAAPCDCSGHCSDSCNSSCHPQREY